MNGVANVPKEALFLLSVAVAAFLGWRYEGRATAGIVAHPLRSGVLSIVVGGVLLTLGVEVLGWIFGAGGVLLLLLSPFARDADE